MPKLPLKELVRYPPYVLWVLRDTSSATLVDLWKQLGLGPSDSSLRLFLEDTLTRLVTLGFVAVKPAVRMHEGIPPGSELVVTPKWKHFQQQFGISLADMSAGSAGWFVCSPFFQFTQERQAGHDVFVLMPFTVELKAVYDDHIVAAVTRLGKTCARADDLFGARSVMSDIWSAIVAAQFIVADCTGRNPNVYYEAGIAHTIGRPVILITQQEADVPSDLRAIRYIRYEFTRRGMRVLEHRLAATIDAIEHDREMLLQWELEKAQRRSSQPGVVRRHR